VTSLTAVLLERAQLKVAVAGNVGPALLDTLRTYLSSESVEDLRSFDLAALEGELLAQQNAVLKTDQEKDQAKNQLQNQESDLEPGSQDESEEDSGNASEATSVETISDDLNAVSKSIDASSSEQLATQLRRVKTRRCNPCWAAQAEVDIQGADAALGVERNTASRHPL
jgi:UDP-N-acetylmuramoylalanine--D-glutamate ligase